MSRAAVRRVQVVQFVTTSSGFASGPANPNIYYANAVNHRVHSSTGLFDRNTDGDIATAIASDLSFIPGGVNIAAGLDDLRSRFTAGQLSTVTFARFAVVVTDGYDNPAPVAQAAAALRAEDVTIIVVAPTGRSDRGNLEAIASSPSLVLEVASFDNVAELLLATIAEIGAISRMRLQCLITATKLLSASCEYFSLEELLSVDFFGCVVLGTSARRHGTTRVYNHVP